jgi:hypothetical protein
MTGRYNGAMQSEELQRLIAKRPVQIRMIDGREMFIEKGQNVMVGDYTAGFLVEDKGSEAQCCNNAGQRCVGDSMYRATKKLNASDSMVVVC